MRIHAAFVLLLLLSGCYCMPDPGDPNAVQDGYFGGCWNKAKQVKR